MTGRDRLIELFSSFGDGTYNGSGTIIDGTKVDDVADYLLANGVIVPPFKFGSTIWIIRNREIYPHKIDHLVISEFGMYSTGISLKWCVGKLGNTVFLTKEEAEEKLKELKENATQKL